MVQDTASALFGVEGLQVIGAEAEADGTVTVRAVTDHPGASVCPDCGTRAVRVHEHVLTRPRDLRRGLDQVSACWLKRRWKCGNGGCGRKTFTESAPQVPPGCRVTARLRELAGAEVAGRGCTVAGAARWQGLSWPVVHQAFAGQADPVLEQPLQPAPHLGTGEHRRGRPRGRIDAESGEYVLLADGGTRASLTCPGARGCWARPGAAPPMTPRTGWPRRLRRGGTPSRWWPPACARSMPRRCAGCCRAPGSWWTCSILSSSP